jgi:hypothetical protein
MSGRELYRAGAVAAIASGVLNLLFFLFHPTSGEPPAAAVVNQFPYAAEHALDIVSLILAPPALTALYLMHVDKLGRISFAGYALAVTGLGSLLGLVWADGLFSPLLATAAPSVLATSHSIYSGPILLATVAGVTCFDAGFIILAVGWLQARVFPSAAVVLVAVGAIVLAAPPPPILQTPWLLLDLGALLFAVGLGWLGLEVWRRA